VGHHRRALQPSERRDKHNAASAPRDEPPAKRVRESGRRKAVDRDHLAVFVHAHVKELPDGRCGCVAHEEPDVEWSRLFDEAVHVFVLRKVKRLRDDMHAMLRAQVSRKLLERALASRNKHEVEPQAGKLFRKRTADAERSAGNDRHLSVPIHETSVHVLASCSVASDNCDASSQTREEESSWHLRKRSSSVSRAACS